MKYVKWQDELASYLGALPREEKDKVFAYFAEMYADKRDAGLSEQEIIEEFGAPYDVAKRILAESGRDDLEKTAPTPPPQPSAPTQHAPAQYAPPPQASYPPQPTSAKKKSKLPWIIFDCAAAAIIASIFIVVFVALGKAASLEFTVQKFTSQSEITAAEVHVSEGSAEYRYYDGNEISVEYPECDDFGYSVNADGGKLSVKPYPRYRGIIWNLTMAFKHVEIPKVTILVPRAYKINLDASLSAGDLTVGGGEYGEVNLSVSAGKLTAEKMTCANCEISISAGKITAEVQCDKFSFDQSAGSAELGEVTCRAADFDISAGSASVAALTCDRLEIDLSAGSCDLSLKGKETDYTVTVDVSAGSCNLSNRSGTVPGKQIDVDVSAGSCNVTFSD